MKMLIPGGSGFLGRLLARWFTERGWTVFVLSRQPSADKDGGRFVPWNGRTFGDWTAELSDTSVVVNMAGRSVNCRYNRKNRDAIMQSRIESTKILGEAIAKCASPPKLWLNSSTATIYKHSYDRPMDELTGEIGATPEAKDTFSISVAEAWEKSLDAAVTPATRKVALRAAMVLAPGSGGVFAVLHRLVRFGLGGTMGHGRQYVSWVHGDDFCRAIEWLIAHEEISGAVNVAAPHPVTNCEMMQTLRRVCGVRLGLPAAKWMLEVGAFLMRTETELILKSRRVVPTRLLQSGFEFQYPEIEGAFEDILRKSKS